MDKTYKNYVNIYWLVIVSILNVFAFSLLFNCKADLANSKENILIKVQESFDAEIKEIVKDELLRVLPVDSLVVVDVRDINVGTLIIKKTSKREFTVHASRKLTAPVEAPSAMRSALNAVIGYRSYLKVLKESRISHTDKQTVHSDLSSQLETCKKKNMIPEEIRDPRLKKAILKIYNKGL